MRLFPILTALLVVAGLFMLVFQRDTLDEAAGVTEAAQIAAETEDRDDDQTGLSVVVLKSMAREIETPIVIRGRTEATRRVELRAETSGQVVSDKLAKGLTVAKGDVMCRLDPGTRDASLAEAKARLAEAKPAIETWETKLGRGRLQDIELLAQAGALMAGDTAPDIQGQLKAACKLGWVSEADMMTLRESYELMWRVQIGAKLLSDRPLDMDDIGEGGRVFMLRETKQTEISQLRADMEERGTIAASIIDHALANVPHGKARR